MEEIEFQSWKGLKIFLVLFFDLAEEVIEGQRHEYLV